MPEKRPAIPAEIKRQVLIESGHMCAVCGTPLPLELAHIIPWHKSKDHTAENLICLCANCHARADKEGWDTKTFRDYKQRPRVARNYQYISSPEPKAEVELILNMEPSQVDEPRRMLLLILIAYILNISMDRIRITSIRKSNSITVTIELPAEAARKLLDAYERNDTELLSHLAQFGLISISISKAPPSRKHYSIYFRDRMARWISYGAIFTAALTFLFGVQIVEHIDKVFKLHEKNPTIIEGVIALLNITLASWVFLDVWLIRPVKMVDDNTPASNSFKQLLFGWKSLWFTWILFYSCLAAQWLRLINEETSFILEPVSHGLNMVNGFFFYYLFFVLDQPSVRTEIEPDRAKAFRRNCIITLLCGFFLLFASVGFSLLTDYIGVRILNALAQLDNSRQIPEEGVLLTKLLPAYIAVGMAFFFGRLDSHYLRLPRIILAPFYLYAIIQLFWGRSTYVNVSNFNPDRVAIFSLALILKFVLFLNLSRLIRHESFRNYFVTAEKGLRDS